MDPMIDIENLMLTLREAESQLGGPGVARNVRRFMIPEPRVCAFCNKTWPLSAQWVVRDDVVMCKSCWTKIVTYTRTTEFPVGTDWYRVCGDRVAGCMCRGCVIRRVRIANA